MARRRPKNRTPAPSPPAMPPSDRPKVFVRCCTADSSTCESLPPERISDVLPQQGALCWVDVSDPGPREMEMLREEFGFHRLALEDAAKHLQRAKVDEYPGYYLVVMYAPVLVPGEAHPELREVDLFIGSNYVVTLRSGPVPALDEAMDRWERTEPELRHQVGFLLYTILDTLVDSYFPLVDRLEDRLDALEIAMFEGKTPGSARKLLAIKRNLFFLRRALYPLRDAFNLLLRRDQPILGSETVPYFQDVYDHVLRLLDTLDLQRDMASGTLDAYLTVVSNRLNETMQRLTLVAICVAVMGAVFGAWGMNFRRIPLADSPIGFWTVVGATLALVAIVIAYARRRKLW